MKGVPWTSVFDIHVIFKQLSCRVRSNPTGAEPGAQPITSLPRSGLWVCARQLTIHCYITSSFEYIIYDPKRRTWQKLPSLQPAYGLLFCISQAVWPTLCSRRKT